MHSFDVYIHIIFFQAFGALIMSCGLTGTMKIIVKFPPIILTSIFSIWTIGPVMSTKSICSGSCNNGHQKLGVSNCFTWINLLITLASGLVYVIRHNEGSWDLAPGNINSCFFLNLSTWAFGPSHY